MLIGMPTSSNILLTFEIFQLLDLIYCDKKGMVVLFIGKRLKSKNKNLVYIFFNDVTYSSIWMCPQQILIMVILVAHKILGSTVICWEILIFKVLKNKQLEPTASVRLFSELVYQMNPPLVILQSTQLE